jgi:hypothetical protein
VRDPMLVVTSVRERPLSPEDRAHDACLVPTGIAA